ncbi:hypothetical protein RA27_10105 [Ruegeria sp. ANG-R]|uniref:hypothetical protein n=1 Tax=Ruegeria sp. ANG-R TaxID=1577903 RepID=UPI00057CD6C5|nr:hypothetical protein [Ruegeria sp. ANG-R]KIC41580.1 hypothetical protein RA27_10105 [Ruegeria sp. ANG-R]
MTRFEYRILLGPDIAQKLGRMAVYLGYVDTLDLAATLLAQAIEEQEEQFKLASYEREIRALREQYNERQRHCRGPANEDREPSRPISGGIDDDHISF